MPATFLIPTQNVIPGQLITAALWNGEYANLYNNFTPAGVDDYSVTDGQMQTQTNPFPGSVISRPTALAGELERLRFVVAGITGLTYWYQPPALTIPQISTFNLGHTHTGGADGTQIPTGGIVDLAITTAKLAAGAVTDVKVADVATTKLTGTIATGQIANSAVDSNKISTSVAGNGLSGGAGSALAVNVDGSTIEIVADTLRVKDLGIVNAKINDVAAGKITGTIVTSQIGAAQVAFANLAADVTNKLSPKSIQRLSGTLSWAGESGNSTEKTTNVAISSVDTTKAYVILNGSAAGNMAALSSGEFISNIKAQLTSATNVELKGLGNWIGNKTASILVYFTVVEWN